MQHAQTKFRVQTTQKFGGKIAGWTDISHKKMRRSAAPSSLPSSKKPRFQTPFANCPSRNCGGPPNNALEQQGKDSDTAPSTEFAQSRLREALAKIRKAPPSGYHTPSSSSSSLAPSLTPSHTPSTSVPATPLSGSRKPAPAVVSGRGRVPVSKGGWSGDPGSSGPGGCCGSVVVEQGNSDKDSQRHYSVMWCKRSTKKHKTWEGDAILTVRGNSVALKDMDGKDIGKGLGYKRSELSALDEGSSLIIGGKQIEIMGPISAEDFKSGKCFTGSISLDTSDTTDTVQTVKKSFKPFKSMKPQRDREELGPVKVSPLYNPDMPGALIMPQPSPKHQLTLNPKGECVVDVVVDPHLSTHLRSHQREGVVFLYQCLMGMRDFAGQGAILADEMGLGKTLQCITVIWTLLKQGPYGLRPVVKKVLVITPGSLVKNWEHEFRKWLGTERLKVYSVSGDRKPEGFVKSPLYPVLIISYEMFLRAQDLLKGVNFDLIVCDEGHRLKNAGTKTTSVISSLPARKRILLTGTPIQNDLQEFYSIVDFCNPSILGSHAAFLKVYEEPIVLSRQQTATAEEREIGRSRADELKRLTSLFCLRRTQEIISKYLPPKVESVVFCRMSSLQLPLYKHLLDSHLVKSCLHSSSAASAASSSFPPHLLCIGALKKLCNCPSLVHSAATQQGQGVWSEEEEAREGNGGSSGNQTLFSDVLKLFPADYDPHGGGVAEGCGKLMVLSEMLYQLFSLTSEKVVIVSNYTQMLDILERFCTCRGYGFLRLDGSTPSSKRQSIVERFNSKHSKEMVFLLSSKAGGVGLNLIGASRLILYDIDWNPANDLQAMARVWRDGQKKKVHIYRLLTTGTIEEKIFQRQITKQGLNTVLDFDCGNTANNSCLNSSGKSGGGGGGRWAAKFSREELRDLFSLREDTLCDTHDLVQSGSGRKGKGRSEQENTKGSRAMVDWDYFPSPLQGTSLSDELLLGGAASNITFVFQSVSQSGTEENNRNSVN